MTETTERQQGRFRKGHSGNPAGRPSGARNRTTLAVESLLDGEAEALTRKVIERALDGDMVAMRLCFDRIAPVRKGRPVEFEFSAPKDAAGLVVVQQRILAAMGSGEITTDEAADAVRVVEAVGQAFERRDLEERVKALEARHGG
jgi:hypothetical protein